MNNEYDPLLSRWFAVKHLIYLAKQKNYLFPARYNVDNSYECNSIQVSNFRNR